MNSKKKFNWKRFILIAGFCVAAAYSFASWEQLKQVVAAVLQSKWSIAFVCIYCLASVGAHRLCTAAPAISGGFAYTHFGKYADSVFACATFALAGTTSLTLLDGVFRQIFFGETHYIGFQTMDLASVFVVSSYLLYYCLTSTTRLFLEVLFQVEAEPITEVNAT